MFKKLKNMGLEFDLCLRRKPYLYVLLLFVCLIATQLVTNIYIHNPLFSNFSNTLDIFWVALVGYLAFRISKKGSLQFLVSFLFTFPMLLIKNLIEKSIVDYTSIIMLIFFAVFSGSVSWILARVLTSEKKALEDSNNAQRNHKQKYFSNDLLILSVAVGILLFNWLRDLFINGWSLKSVFNILIMLLFLVYSYVIEMKTSLSNKFRLLFYFLYFFVIGTFASAVIHQNQLNGQMIFLYIFLSFIGSLVWLFICKQLKTKK